MPPDAAIQERLTRLGLRAEDFTETFARASGPGGQHVNKTSTAATVRHVPDGLSATCSDTRSQARNRSLAWERLLDRIESCRRTERAEKIAVREQERRRKRPRPRGLQRRILEDKRRRGETKKLRRKVD